MFQYMIEKRILIKDYIHIRNYVEIQNTFGIKFSVQRVPYKFGIYYSYQNFCVQGIYLKQNKGIYGGSRSAKTEENITFVQKMFRYNPGGKSYC